MYSYLIILKGKCNAGCLEALCMQKMHTGQAWEVSDKLKDTNNQTGVFSN